jgi:hypothetical protein
MNPVMSSAMALTAQNDANIIVEINSFFIFVPILPTDNYELHCMPEWPMPSKNLG